MLTPRDPCGAQVARGFVELGHGRVHYRTAGNGPPVVALHASPSSSLSLLPVIEALAGNHAVIALDTPGYGLSDPLSGDHPCLNDFSDALAAVLDRLGLARAGVYGTHTGAAIAATFAARFPGRVSRLVLDGVSAFTPDEIDSFCTAYLEPHAPHWDGRHVMSLWSRVRDLYTWFPWHERSATHRLAFDPPALPVLARSALGFIQAGVHYSKAYVCAAKLDPSPLLRRLVCPVLLMARETDLIADHLDRIESGPWEVRRVKDDEAWRVLLVEAFAPGDHGNLRHDRPAEPVIGERGGFLKLGEGWLNLHALGPLDGPLRLCLPDIPGDARAMAEGEGARYPASRIVAVDLPGCGWSDPLAQNAGGLSAIIDVLDTAMERLSLRVNGAKVVAEGATGVVGALWRARRERLGHPLFELELRNAPNWFADPTAMPHAPPLTWVGPRWDGTHLTGAWLQIRDRLMYEAPPGSAPCVRAPGTHNGIDLGRLSQLFRLYVEGPNCAEILGWCMAAVGDRPDLIGQQALKTTDNRISVESGSGGRKNEMDLTGLPS